MYAVNVSFSASESSSASSSSSSSNSSNSSSSTSESSSVVTTTDDDSNSKESILMAQAEPKKKQGGGSPEDQPDVELLLVRSSRVPPKEIHIPDDAGEADSCMDGAVSTLTELPQLDSHHEQYYEQQYSKDINGHGKKQKGNRKKKKKKVITPIATRNARAPATVAPTADASASKKEPTNFSVAPTSKQEEENSMKDRKSNSTTGVAILEEPASAPKLVTEETTSPAVNKVDEKTGPETDSSAVSAIPENSKEQSSSSAITSTTASSSMDQTNENDKSGRKKKEAKPTKVKQDAPPQPEQDPQQEKSPLENELQPVETEQSENDTKAPLKDEEANQKDPQTSLTSPDRSPPSPSTTTKDIAPSSETKPTVTVDTVSSLVSPSTSEPPADTAAPPVATTSNTDKAVGDGNQNADSEVDHASHSTGAHGTRNDEQSKDGMSEQDMQGQSSMTSSFADATTVAAPTTIPLPPSYAQPFASSEASNADTPMVVEEKEDEVEEDDDDNVTYEYDEQSSSVDDDQEEWEDWTSNDHGLVGGDGGDVDKEVSEAIQEMVQEMAEDEERNSPVVTSAPKKYNALDDKISQDIKRQSEKDVNEKTAAHSLPDAVSTIESNLSGGDQIIWQGNHQQQETKADDAKNIDMKTTGEATAETVVSNHLPTRPTINEGVALLDTDEPDDTTQPEMDDSETKDDHGNDDNNELCAPALSSDLEAKPSTPNPAANFPGQNTTGNEFPHVSANTAGNEFPHVSASAAGNEFPPVSSALVAKPAPTLQREDAVAKQPEDVTSTMSSVLMGLIRPTSTTAAVAAATSSKPVSFDGFPEIDCSFSFSSLVEGVEETARANVQAWSRQTPVNKKSDGNELTAAVKDEEQSSNKRNIKDSEMTLGWFPDRIVRCDLGDAKKPAVSPDLLKQLKEQEQAQGTENKPILPTETAEAPFCTAAVPQTLLSTADSAAPTIETPPAKPAVEESKEMEPVPRKAESPSIAEKHTHKPNMKKSPTTKEERSITGNSSKRESKPKSKYTEKGRLLPEEPSHSPKKRSSPPRKNATRELEMELSKSSSSLAQQPEQSASLQSRQSRSSPGMLLEEKKEDTDSAILNARTNGASKKEDNLSAPAADPKGDSFEEFTRHLGYRRRELVLGMQEHQKEMKRLQETLTKLRSEFSGHVKALGAVGQAMQTLDDEELKKLEERAILLRTLAETKKKKCKQAKNKSVAALSAIATPNEMMQKYGGSNFVMMDIPHIDSKLVGDLNDDDDMEIAAAAIHNKNNNNTATKSIITADRKKAMPSFQQPDSSESTWEAIDNFLRCGHIGGSLGNGS